MRRVEGSSKIFLSDGTALVMTIRDSLLPDDIIAQGAKAEGYRVMTGRDVFPVVDRATKDYLLRFRVVTE